MEEDAEVVAGLQVPRALDQDALQLGPGAVVVLHAPKRHRVAEAQLDVVRVELQRRLELRHRLRIVLVVEDQRGEVLARIHVAGSGLHGALELGECLPYLVLFEVDEAEEVADGRRLLVDLQGALTHEFSKFEAIGLVVHDGHVQVGVQVVRVPEEPFPAEHERLLVVAPPDLLVRKVVQRDGAVLVEGQGLLHEATSVRIPSLPSGDQPEHRDDVRVRRVQDLRVAEVPDRVAELPAAEGDDAEVVRHLDPGDPTLVRGVQERLDHVQDLVGGKGVLLEELQRLGERGLGIRRCRRSRRRTGVRGRRLRDRRGGEAEEAQREDDDQPLHFAPPSAAGSAGAATGGSPPGSAGGTSSGAGAASSSSTRLLCSSTGRCRNPGGWERCA